MPDWTSNTIKCKKHIGDKILIKDNDDYIFDFNKLIPMPTELDIDPGTAGEEGLMYLYIKSKNDLEKDKINDAYTSVHTSLHDIIWDSKFKEIEDNIDKYENDESFKEFISLGEKYLANYEKYGYCHWYDWCEDNWGTKWNACDVDVFYDEVKEEYEIFFCTAWSVPEGIVEKYSELCKDDEFYWAYEDDGSEERHVLTKENGEIIDTVILIEED